MWWRRLALYLCGMLRRGDQEEAGFLSNPVRRGNNGIRAPTQLEVLRRTVREREPIVDQYHIPAAKDLLIFDRVTLPVWEDRRGVWQVIQGMHLAPGLEILGLQPGRGRGDHLWCRHPAGTFL